MKLKMSLSLLQKSTLVLVEYDVYFAFLKILFLKIHAGKVIYYTTLFTFSLLSCFVLKLSMKTTLNWFWKNTLISCCLKIIYIKELYIFHFKIKPCILLEKYGFWRWFSVNTFKRFFFIWFLAGVNILH